MKDTIKFKVGEKVLHSVHNEKASIIAIIKPVAHHYRRYVVVHDRDGYATICEERDIEPLEDSTDLIGENVEVKVGNITYTAIIKGKKVEDDPPF